MSRGDLAGFLRGLQSITRALIDLQGKELQRGWNNSSIKSATQGLGHKLEETINNVVTKPGEVQKTLQDRVSELSSQAGMMVESLTQGSKVINRIMQGQSSADPVQTEKGDENLDLSNPITAMEHPVTSGVHQEPFLKSKTATILESEPIQESLYQKDMVSLNTTADDASRILTPLPKVDSATIQKEQMTQKTASVQKEQMTKKTELLKSDSIKISRTITTVTSKPKKYLLDNFKPQLSERSKERKVPSSRLSRVMTFGGLAAGIGFGALAEVTKRSLGLKKEEVGSAILDKNPFLTEANAERIVNTLCRVRGAALKLGQMLSIQDNSLLNPELQKILERVRQSADIMPTWQMEKVMNKELGPDWRNKFESFDDKPFAAASIGQVHKARLFDGRDVALKIQYPGVAMSIDSDINNLMSILNVWNILPKGLYVENVMKVAKTELTWEVDYIREANCALKFRELFADDPILYIPAVIMELTTPQILTAEFVEGLPLDKCLDMDQETRNKIGDTILRLCFTELFVFRYMQTDPNWSNFLYNPVTDKVILLDFGATREYSKEFVDKYIQVIKAASVGDTMGILKGSRDLGFLTGYETKAMEEAHVDAVMILGEALASEIPFDFAKQSTTRRVQDLIPVMMKHRLSPPPEETYSLHRKMSGAFLLCAKLGAQIDCKSMFDKIWNNYKLGTESNVETAV
ncbi:hypothetical protein CHS0354_032758 [Potamilus streckersoni]|uniref:ABC1 atypical kinase-like domain-containing protein n=1 Tax=Potamilus streckersoni TaxID=2493646 RepID=A0AAE0WE99_9BIVA|nr:hypothetical protein CHS0354_032758 [Potamilus streckersoni]